MKQRLLYPVLGTMILVACSDSVRNQEELPSSPGVIVAAPPVSQPPGCSFRDAKSYARDYFLVNTDRNAATSALMAAESFAVGSQDRTNSLFTVLGLVAQVGGGSGTSTDAGPPSAGANLVSEIVDCGPLVVTDNRGFLGTLASALTTGEGEFAIRGTSAGDEPVIAESGDVAIAPNDATDPEKPDWDVQVGRVAVFVGQVSGIGFGGIGTELVTPYRIGLIYEQSPPRATPPDFTDDDYFAVEFCGSNLPDDPDDTEIADQQRVGRSRGMSNQLNAVLQQSDIEDFCSVLGATTGSLPRSFFARVVNRMAGFFMPTPLQALIVAPPPWSGSTGGLESDFGVVEVDNVIINGTQGIPGGVKGQAISFSISAFTDPGSSLPLIPLENVAITVTVAGNQGSPVFLSSGNSGTSCATDGLSCTAHTDETGAANFSVIFDKAGGYTLNITAAYSGFADIVHLSNLFNITGG